VTIRHVIPASTVWRCRCCSAPLGRVEVDPATPALRVQTRQLAAQVAVPVTWLCGRCGAANALAPADLERWWRRGGQQPLVAGVPRSTLARPA
jgi:hypothetical protein